MYVLRVKKVNKNIKKQKIAFLLIMLLIILLIILAALFFYLNSQSYINKGPINATEDNNLVDDVTAKNASAIILNNVLLGGVNDKTWIGAEKMYGVLSENTELDMYSAKGLLGTYNTSLFKEANQYYYTKTTKYPEPEEYIGLQTNSKVSFSPMDKIQTDEKDIANVKQALGKYILLNGSVRINEAYQVRFRDGELGKIYSVTSNGKNIFGVYSAIVYSYAGNSVLIKYSYAKDAEYATAWPVYSIKYVMDLNCDGINELILQETTANAVRYVVDEMVKKDVFMEVLKVSIKI